MEIQSLAGSKNPTHTANCVKKKSVKRRASSAKSYGARRSGD